MLAKWYDKAGNKYELEWQYVQTLCEKMVHAAILSDEKYQTIFQKEYVNKMHRFSKEFSFCIHELNWKLEDPFCESSDFVLISNGSSFCLVSKEEALNSNFNNRGYAKNIIAPKLTDRILKYDEDLNNIDAIDEGIIDELGYVSSQNIDIEILSKFLVLDDLINHNKEGYASKLMDEYLEYTHKYGHNALEFYTQYENKIAINKIDNKFVLSYISENTGKVKKFIEELENKDLIADVLPAVSSKKDLMVA